MGIVPGRAQEAVEDLLEVAAQLFLALGVTLAQHRLGEAAELERVVIGEGHTHAQRLAEAAATQGGHGRGEGMQGGATVDTHGLALIAQFTGVAGGAADIEVVRAGLGVLVAGQAHGQVAGVLRRGLLLRVDQEAKACQVLGTGELVVGKWQFQRDEPVIAQALNQGALGGVVVSLALLLTPLVEVVQLARRLVGRQVGVGDVIKDDCQACQEQHERQQKDTA
ncbi:hypothetical protein D3C81_1480460 [compost metagenome]